MWLNLMIIQLLQYLPVFKGESAVAFFLLEELHSCSLPLSHHIHRLDKSKSLAYSAWC